MPDARPKLDDTGIKQVQAIVGALLYYGCAVYNKLLVALRKLGSTQAAATELTKTDLSQLLDYLSTYPDDGILYRSSVMILSAHSNAAYLNVSRARSRAGAHIMLSENTPVPSLNGPVLTIAQIIKNVMSSAAEAKLSGLFICAKAMIPLRNTLTEMGWPQPPSPVQCDNPATTGFTNKTMVKKFSNTWTYASGGSDAAAPNKTSPTTGHQETKTWPTTVQSITPPLYHLYHWPTHTG